MTGRDIGTPIIQFKPPVGAAVFGPVISRLPTEAEAMPLWLNVLGLASFPGFAELKRSLRERPQLRGYGVEPDQIGIQEDWHAGRRAPFAFVAGVASSLDILRRPGLGDVKILLAPARHSRARGAHDRPPWQESPDASIATPVKPSEASAAQPPLLAPRRTR